MEADALRYSGDSSHEMVGSSLIIKQTLPNESNPRRSCITVGPLTPLTGCAFPERVISVGGCAVAFYFFYFLYEQNRIFHSIESSS